MEEPEFTEVKIVGKNLFRILHPDAKESIRVLNFTTAELEIKFPGLDYDNPDFQINNETATEAVIFSRKSSSK